MLLPELVPEFTTGTRKKEKASIDPLIFLYLGGEHIFSSFFVLVIHRAPLRPKFECREPQFTLKLAKMWKNFVNSLFTKKCNLNYAFEIAFFFFNFRNLCVPLCFKKWGIKNCLALINLEKYVKKIKVNRLLFIYNIIITNSYSVNRDSYTNSCSIQHCKYMKWMTWPK